MMRAADEPRAQGEQTAANRIVQVVAAFVVVLVAALVGMSALAERTEAGKRHETIERMQQVEEALARYLIDASLLPTGTQGLRALLARPTQGPQPANWDGPYVSGPEMLKDAWGTDFQYVMPGKPRDGHKDIYYPYSLWSYGADGVEGGEKLDADIRSWDRTTMIP